MKNFTSKRLSKTKNDFYVFEEVSQGDSKSKVVTHVALQDIFYRTLITEG